MNSEKGRFRVVGTGGTMREGSTSLGALRRALSAADEAGAEVELLDLRQLRLPMYEPGRPLDDHDPEVWRIIEVVRRAAAMVHIVHALRDVVAPQMMLIGCAWKRFDAEWNVTGEGLGRRLDRLGRLVVDMAEALTRGLKDRDAEAVGVAL